MADTALGISAVSLYRRRIRFARVCLHAGARSSAGASTHARIESGRLLAKTKQPTSKAIKQILLDCRSPLVETLTVQERPGKHCFRFWQEGPGFDRNIYSPQALAASMDYIHLNPVKRGLCDNCTNWKWSSAGLHLDGASDSDLPELIRPDPSWFDTSGVQTEFG